MKKNTNVKNTNLRLNIFNLLIMVCIPLFILSKKLYVLFSIYILLLSSWVIWINIETVRRNIRIFFVERKKLKQLEYYHITDDNKIIDLEKRKNVYNLFQNITVGIIFVLIFDFFALRHFIQSFLGKLTVLNVLTFFGVVIFIGYGGMLAGIVYKYTTTIYVLIPIFSGMIYFCFVHSIISFMPNFAKVMSYLIITLFLYCIFVYLFPVHIIRKLNTKTVLISSFLTILTTFLSQILLFYFTSYLKTKNYFLTINDLKNTTNISDTLRNIILENTELVSIINYFVEKECSSQLMSITSLVITAFTTSYIFGGIIINRKIRKNKIKAKSIYRNLVKDATKINYQLLIQCSFYGGEEYENLILNNNLMLKVVIENESNLDIPDVSRKKRFIEWCTRNSVLYSLYMVMK